MATASSKRRAFVCNESDCGRAFIRSEHLARHRLNHQPNQVYACDECHKKFVRQDLLLRHKRRHEKGMWMRRSGGIVATNVHSQDALTNTTAPSQQSPEQDNLTEGPSASQEGHSPGPPEQNGELRYEMRSTALNWVPDTSFSTIQPLFAAESSFAAQADGNHGIDWLLRDLSDHGTGESLLNWEPEALLFDEVSPFEAREFATALTHNSSNSDDLWQSVRARIVSQTTGLPTKLLDEPFFKPVNLASFYESFFENYHPQFPILHRPTLNPTECPPLLLLSLLTLGATLAPDVVHYHTATKIHEHLRGIIFNSGGFNPPAPLWCLQALLLIQAQGKMFASRRHHEVAHIFHGAIITLMRRGSVLQACNFGGEGGMNTSINPSLADWVAMESSRRTAFFAFIMDAQHASIFGHSPALSVNDVRLPLPCPDELWECNDFAQLEQIFASHTKPLEFLSVLKRLVNKAPVPRTCSPYARSILLHGLFSVTAHLKAREAATLGLGISKNSMDDNRDGEASQHMEDWRDTLGQAIMVSSFSCSAKQPSLCLDALRTLHRMAHIAIHVDIVDVHVSARAPSLLGHMILPADVARADQRIQRWSETIAAKRAVRQALMLIQETVFAGERYRAWEDNIALRPWCLYHAALVCWVYGSVVEQNRPSLRREATSKLIAMPAEEYLVRMLAYLEPDGVPFVELGRSHGLIEAVRSCLRGCRWELLEEAHATLGHLVEDRVT